MPPRYDYALCCHKLHRPHLTRWDPHKATDKNRNTISSTILPIWERACSSRSITMLRACRTIHFRTHPRSQHPRLLGVAGAVIAIVCFRHVRTGTVATAVTCPVTLLLCVQVVAGGGATHGGNSSSRDPETSSGVMCTTTLRCCLSFARHIA